MRKSDKSGLFLDFSKHTSKKKDFGLSYFSFLSVMRKREKSVRDLFQFDDRDPRIPLAVFAKAVFGYVSVCA